jgi:hypothetical protein
MTRDEMFPEAECVDNGDPYLTEIVKADDIIDDHRFDDDPAAQATADWVERERLSYELAALYAWWALSKGETL